MRRLHLALLLLLAAPAASAVDLVLHNGKVWTGDGSHPGATAIAIDQGKVVAVGDDAGMLALATEDSQRIDLKGRRVIPGINDAHVHLGAWWKSTHLEFPSPDPSRSELEAALKAQPADGEGWLSATIGPQLFNDPGFGLAALDALHPNRPVILGALTGHGTVVNSAAQRLLRIDPAVAVPGGWYGKDAQGRFDGRLYEYAQWRMRLLQPPLPDEAEIRDLQGYAQELLRYGTTSVQAMSLVEPQRLVALWGQAGVPQRLRLMRIPTPGALDEPVPGASLPRTLPDAPRVTVSGTKWILDGTPLEYGAAVRTPYPGGHGEGRMNFSRAELEDLLREIVARDDQPLVHICGDAATEVLLDAMAAIAPAEAWRPRRLRIEHGDGLRDELLERARDFGVVVVQNPSHFLFPDPYMAGSQLAGFLQAGIPLAIGSDGPPSPWLNMAWAMQPPAAPGQALEREQVLRAYTMGSAYAEFEEGRKGRLLPGYLADLAVLSQDVLDPALPVEALPGTSSVLTMIDGRVAWRDPAL